MYKSSHNNNLILIIVSWEIHKNASGIYTQQFLQTLSVLSVINGMLLSETSLLAACWLYLLNNLNSMHKISFAVADQAAFGRPTTFWY